MTFICVKLERGATAGFTRSRLAVLVKVVIILKGELFILLSISGLLACLGYVVRVLHHSVWPCSRHEPDCEWGGVAYWDAECCQHYRWLCSRLPVTLPVHVCLSKSHHGLLHYSDPGWSPHCCQCFVCAPHLPACLPLFMASPWVSYDLVQWRLAAGMCVLLR
jgi:hypothetical protein